MNMKTADAPTVHLHTGGCHIAVQPCMVSVILGSCVSVTMFDPKLHMGAACHVFLPDRSRGGSLRGGADQPCRYAVEAVPLMFRELVELGAGPRRLVIKLFGGSDGFTNPNGRHMTVGMGKENVTAAIMALKKLSLTPVVMNVGGNLGRKLLFNTFTGEAWIKRLQSDLRQTEHQDLRNPAPNGRPDSLARQRKDST